MLRTCDMDLRYTIYFMLLPCVLSLVVCASHFELIKSSGQQTGEQRTRTFLQKTFFQCDRQSTCTHVIQLDGSGEYVVVHGEDALEKIINTRMIWKKMAINIVRGNIALGKPSDMSSLWRNHTIAALAVDGNKATTSEYCAQTKSELNAWLRVDLQASATIESVSILSFKTQSRFMDAFDVRAGYSFQNGGVGNPPCQLNVNIPVNSSSLHVQCPSGLIGRYITVNTHGTDFIEICELEVYGYYV